MMRAQHKPLSQRRETCFKTKMCKFYAAGICARGVACLYAHSSAEARELPNLYKTQLCTLFSFNGSCSKGDACVFAHGSKELRNTPTSTSPTRTPKSQIVLPARGIGRNNHQNDVVLPHVANAINAPHVQTDCFPMTASMTKVGWNSFFLQQSWSPTMVGVQEFPHTGPLSTQSCLNAVDDFRNDQKDKEGEELRSKADVRVMLGCDKRPHSCVEVDSDVESSLEIPGAENVLWERNTTAEGQWAIQDFSRQTSMSSVTALEANAGPSTTAGAKPEAEARYLTILNTFLHWGPSDSSPATRSKSAGGRVEGVQI